MARKRDETPYERTSKILGEYNYKISSEGIISLNGSSGLGRIASDGKLEILSDALSNHKTTLKDHSEQDGIRYSFVDIIS